MAYSSNGFPTDKVIKYVNKYNPYLINDPETQLLLQNRKWIKKQLIANNIPTPKCAIVDNNNPNHKIIEYDDKIIVNGIEINKPFVEKPLNADDHNVYIYFKNGGSRRLFRKIKNKSSKWSNCSNIRKNGSFIYEEFIESIMDIKVYTVGEKYVYAESRKAPVIDGIVERDVNGKEKRYLCELTNDEKQIAKKVVEIFKQKVCGFDIIRDRMTGKPYVIDVNGYSIVKGESTYHNTCGDIIRSMCLKYVESHRPIQSWLKRNDMNNALMLYSFCESVTKMIL